MEGSFLPPNTVLDTAPDEFMDLDYMDELLLEGCWHETNVTDFSQFNPSTPISPFEPSFAWPLLESNEGPSNDSQQEDRQRLSVSKNLSISQSQSNAVQNASNLVPWPENNLVEAQMRWIGRRPSISVVDRLIQVINHIKEKSRDKDMLIQLWVPIAREGKCVLTTHNQPYSLDLNCPPSLAHYRNISVNYQFVADEDCKEAVGLPGRVFMYKVPEWTLDVRFFTSDEYPRVGHAHKFDVRGTFAVPVIEQGSRSCLGVIEVVLTKQKIRYRPELESVCEALEAVNLKSADITIKNDDTTTNLPYLHILPEILDVLRSACETHGLPLAQTWAPCFSRGRGLCWRCPDGSNCLSPVEAACHVSDPRILGFHEACTESHLLRGQGIVGKAFTTNKPCFSPDVSACSKAEYPLSHHARVFGLRSAVAIRLRSISTGMADFVLEFFLPTPCGTREEQVAMLDSISSTIREVSRTLRVVTDEEVEGNVGGGKSGEMGPTGLRLIDGKRRRARAEKPITLELLRQHFAGSLKDAAKNLGVCPTTLKRICRQLGIHRWPSRKIKKVGHSLQKIQRVIDSVHGASGVLQLESFYTNFPDLTSPNTSQMGPASSTMPPPVVPRPTPPLSSLSPSSSCSQNSSSSQCYSSESHPISYSPSHPGHEGPAVKDEHAEGPNNTTESSRNPQPSFDGPRILPRSQSHALFCGPEQPEIFRPAGPREMGGQRVKVSYGEDTIRFRMQSGWAYDDLLREISRRFGVAGDGGFHLKYLDDDGEWVLLTCDDDLEECMDVCRSTGAHPIRLLFVRDLRGRFNSRLSA